MGMDEAALAELAESIKRHGLLFPLIVVPAHFTAANGELAPPIEGRPPAEVLLLRWEIVDGHRRYVAAGLAGLDELECKIFPTLEDAKFGVMLDANTCREDVTAAEEGLQFVELADKRGWSMPQMQKYFGRSESYINERARLVKDFPDVFQRVAAREVNWSQAKAVMRCPDAQWRAHLLEQATVHGASARTIISQVDLWKSMELAKAGAPAVHTPEHGIAPVMPERPRCLYCTRDDDPGNLTTVPVHTYHLRDLKDFLERVGLNRPAGPGGA
jgi:ParB family chromosome partitioning protein